MAVQVSGRDVLAFRLRAHHLTDRADLTDLAEVVGRCAVQDSPPGSALLALHARVRDITADRLAEALDQQRTLVQTWSLRGAPFLLPTADAPVFTTGVLPPTEDALRHLLLGLGPALDDLGLTVTGMAGLVEAPLRRVLAGRRLTVDELGTALAAEVAPVLTAGQQDVWWQPGPWSPGQPVGEGVVHFCLRVLTLRGTVCFAPRDGRRSPFVLVDEWLGHPLPQVDPALARAELVRRYLRCYGPSTRAGFAGWLGVRPGDVAPWWDPVADQLVAVEQDGARGWLLATDLDALRGATMPTGVRLLPPRDPYTQVHDRRTLVDPGRHRAVWPAVGAPGVVLVDGEVLGTWRPRKRGRSLTLTVTPFGPGPLPERCLPALRTEAEQVAVLRGAARTDLVLDTP